ncbi:hypothetical protein H0H81_007911 [Sphagnurus paluster]|uniref:HMG box domain-containing protein n=1 Tax=Sphagnurus paluster TaxID=117069 RepID=A0A9P7FZ47_9AGAR|nr:hypothetical protein H0H81_007911 [Sphagnurus paluster]
MENSNPMKREECQPASYGQLDTNPLYPNHVKSEGSLFGAWEFPGSRTPAFHFQHTSMGSSLRDAPQSTPVHYYQQNVDGGTTYLGHSAHSSPSSPQKSSRAHIPRPPNAFMLYRSDFLKRGVIPAHVERRQQNLSRIAGQCWNLLPPEEKAQWQERAAQVLIEHQKCNPDYKFTPAPRGSRRSKVKGPRDGETDVVDGEDRIRQIREEYTRISGPAASPARRRRPRASNRGRDLDKEPLHRSPISQASTASLPPSVPPSPSPSLSSASSASKEASLPPFFPQYSFPHIVIPRRPSTSLGFSSATVQDPAARPGHNLIRPSSAVSETGLTSYIRDLDIVSGILALALPPFANSLFKTPTAATFPKLSSPATPASPIQTLPYAPWTPSEPTPALREAISFSECAPPLSTLSQAEKTAIGGESFLSTLYSSESFTFNLPNLSAPAEYAFSDSYLFDQYMPSSFAGGWELETSLSIHKSYSL